MYLLVLGQETGVEVNLDVFSGGKFSLSECSFGTFVQSRFHLDV